MTVLLLTIASLAALFALATAVAIATTPKEAEQPAGEQVVSLAVIAVTLVAMGVVTFIAVA